ncbi:MAG: DegT/DnrJ/EryC1/StrS family aminotransferase [Flavobacteriaceae bacterium]|nr:DegT/DnrJ/EryC1/StrS family aminotransferase [Flavobacteriaceae bacterium]
MKVPFLDLHKINARYDVEFQEVFKNFLDSGYYILGDQVRTFETEFAKYCGTNYCVGVANGLDALRLILEAYIQLGKMSKGDEVLVASNTYIATILGIKQAGLTPVLVESETSRYSFNVTDLQQHLSSKTKAIMPVHLYGQLAPMEAIRQFAKDNDLMVIEDAAQAHGACDENGKRAGNLGDAAGFSFYPTKNLGALGDGGAVTTNNEALAELVAKLRNYGFSQRYVSDWVGVNSRLDEVQAALLNVKLKDLDSDNEARRTIAKKYLAEINNELITLPEYEGGKDHIFHLFVVRVTDRDHFKSYLNENEIGHLVHYPIPPHKQKALSELSHLQFPITEAIHDTIVSIPISPVMTDDQVNKIITVLNRYS